MLYAISSVNGGSPVSGTNILGGCGLKGLGTPGFSGCSICSLHDCDMEMWTLWILLPQMTMCMLFNSCNLSEKSWNLWGRKSSHLGAVLECQATGNATQHNTFDLNWSHFITTYCRVELSGKTSPAIKVHVGWKKSWRSERALATLVVN